MFLTMSLTWCPLLFLAVKTSGLLQYILYLRVVKVERTLLADSKVLTTKALTPFSTNFFKASSLGSVEK